MSHQQQGFTLIELIIVVLIIGILWVIARPNYCDYTVRAQINEGINMSNEIKDAISKYWNTHKVLPINAAVAGLAPAGSYAGTYVTSIAVTNGTITITYGRDKIRAEIADKKLTIWPVSDSAGNLVWVCGKANTPVGTALIGATSNGGAPNFTDIDNRFLSSSCRP